MTPIAIVCIGDMHFKPGDRQADREAALDQIIRDGLALPNLGAWLVTGDVFDAAAAAKDCNGIDERFQRMASAGPVIVAYGNHDRPGDLDGFGRLASTWPITVIDRPQTVRVHLRGLAQYLSIFVLPYPHRGGLVAAGVAPGAIVDTAADLLEPIFMVAAHELGAAAARGDLTLMMGHVNVAGAVASTGQPNIGHEIELSPRHLDRLGAIPKILGHIHKPQEIAGAHYVGSICRLDYGEIEEKRWLEVEFTDEDTRLISHLIDVAPMYHIDGILDRDGFHFEHDDWMCPTCHGTGDGVGDLSCVPCSGSGRRPSWAGCDVRVRYTYQASERAALDPELARLPFATALRLKVEGVAQADRELRAPAVALARTLPEKLAAYRQEATLAPSLAEKVALLERRDEPALLSSLAIWLSSVEQPEKETVAA